MDGSALSRRRFAALTQGMEAILMAATPTRERLVTEAMRLFSTHGYEATTVTQIETAAGLSGGSGALYRHFKSKDALLEAGISRQLDRRRAMADIRALFAGLGDLHAELTALGRYLNSVITQESELLQIAVRTPAGRSAQLDAAHTALIGGLTTELTDWISSWAPSLPSRQREAIAAIAFNSLLGAHVAAGVDRQGASPPAEYLTEWTALLATRIEKLNAEQEDLDRPN